ncbi:DUF2267 domain-containing protein [Vulgatibacter sp.]|uniref:DUF2267 domain-containing protein n=1 Tax=Vulgatibacter sp. TaxID=1971226 RepID=UPI0035632DB7
MRDTTMRESAREVTGDFLQLSLAEQLLVLRRIVPAVADRLEKGELLGFLRDLFGEAAWYERHGGVQGERPTRRGERFSHAARDQKAWRFLKEVAAEAELDAPGDAAPPVAAVLCAVQRRISEREAQQFLAQLPEGIQALGACDVHADLATGDSSFGRQGFLVQVASHAELGGEEDADRVAGAVFRVVRRWISEGEMRDVESQLPADMKGLLG